MQFWFQIIFVFHLPAGANVPQDGMVQPAHWKSMNVKTTLIASMVELVLTWSMIMIATANHFILVCYYVQRKQYNIKLLSVIVKYFGKNSI